MDESITDFCVPGVYSLQHGSGTLTPLQPVNLARNAANFIDLTNDDEPSSTETSDDCVAVLPIGSVLPNNSSPNENGDSMDDSLSIVYENVKPPPNINVDVDKCSGDIIVELLRQNPAPYNGSMTKKMKLGPNNVNVTVTVNTVKKVSSSGAPSAHEIQKKFPLYKEKQPESPTSTSSTNNSTIDCGICLDSYAEIIASNRNLVSTSCGHVFCNLCIEKWRGNYKNCPKCRKKLNKKSYHPLYLS